MQSGFRVALVVAVGYCVMAIVATVGNAIAAQALGLSATRALTTPFLAASVAISFAAAMCGGYACARLAAPGRALLSIGLLIVVLLAMTVVGSRLSPTTSQPPGYVPLVALLSVIAIWAGAMIERAIHGHSRNRIS